MPYKYNPFTGSLDYFEELKDISFVEYPSGSYVDFLPNYTSQTSGGFGANIFFGAIVRVYSNIQIEESFARVASASSGAGLLGIYKYNNLTTDWELVVNTGALDLSLVGTQFLSYAPVSLDPGIYAMGWILENATTMDRAQLTSQELIFGRSTLNISTGYKNIMQFNYAYDGTLPIVAPSPSVTSSSVAVPLTYHKII